MIGRVFKHLKEAARAQHPKGGMQTASVCICGSGGGGPCGSPACRDLQRLQEFFHWAKVDLLPCKKCSALVLPNERAVNPFTGETWEDRGSLCESCWWEAQP